MSEDDQERKTWFILPNKLFNMGNCCASKPKTSEGTEKVPESVTEEVTVEKKESETNVETNNTEENPRDNENESLGTLLNEVCYIHFFP